MSVTGDIVEVRVQSRGSQLVGDHTSGASSIVVADPTDFDTAGGMLLLDGTVYTWTSVTLNGTDDEATATLAITPNLAANEPDTMPVELWSGAQVIDDVVLTVDAGGDTPAYVSLRSDQRKDWTALEGYLEPPVPATFSDDFSVLLDADGYTPTLDASNAQGLPDAPTVAVAAPTTTPTLLVTGFPTSVMAAVTNQPDSPSMVRFYISTSNASPMDSTTALPDSREFVKTIAALKDGTPLAQPPSSYYVAAAFVNNAGVGPASAWVQTALDPSAISTIAAQVAVLGFVLTKRIQFGLGYLDANEGIVLPNPDGSQTKFPVDGVTPAQIAAYLIAKALTVSNGMQVYGSSQFFGPNVLANGITDPTATPSYSRYWASATYSVLGTTSDLGPSRHGLVLGIAAAERVTATAFFGGGLTVFNTSNNTAATVGGSTWGTGYNPTGGVTRIGTNFYTLGFRSDGTWWVYAFDSTLAKTGEWQFTGDPTSTYVPAIGTDGTYVLIGRSNAAGTAYNVRTFTTAGATSTAGATGTAVVTTTTGGGTDLSAVYAGTADYGSTRVVLAIPSGTIRAYNTSGVRQTTAEFLSAGNAPINGLLWDGTSFHHLDNNGTVWDYSTDNPADTTPDIAFAWRDGNATGGTHETRAELTRTSIVRKARSGLTITGADAPDAKVTDPTKTDKANLVTIYASTTTGGTLRLQASPAVEISGASIASISTGTAAAKTSNEFAGVVGSVGSLASAAVDGSSVPLTQFDGSGKVARAAKLIQSGSVAVTVTTAGTAASATVTFPVAFQTAPIVTVSANAANTSFVAVKTSVTTTGFTAWAVRPTTGAVNVDWIATTAA